MNESAHARPTPVFVLGLDRSGTTWLANILANNPNAVAVVAEDHFGIHESIFFSHFARAFGDLDDDENFARFSDAFTTSDYYVLSGLEPEWLVRRRPRSYAEAFRAVMDELARREGADAWIEKSPSHTLLAEELARDFPDARFVGIARAPSAVIASVLAVAGEPPRYPRRALEVVQRCRDCSLYERWLRRFCREHDQLFTTYEALAADPEEVARRAAAFIGIEFSPEMLDLPWRRNTSFQSGEGRRRSLSVADRLLVAVTMSVLRLVPVSVLRALKARREARAEVVWPPWCWRRRDAGALG